VFTPRSFLFLVSSPFLFYFDLSCSHNSLLSYQTFFPFLFFYFVSSLPTFQSAFLFPHFYVLLLFLHLFILSFFVVFPVPYHSLPFAVLYFLFIFSLFAFISLFSFCLFAFLHLFCPFYFCFVLLPLTLSRFLFSSFFLSLHGDEFFQWEKRNEAIAYIEKCQTGLRSICQKIFFACLKVQSSERLTQLLSIREVPG
jgi:hypothetical protein